MRVTLPLFLPPPGKPYGYQGPTQWEAFAVWMQENDLLRESAGARNAFTNDYVPGSGL